MIRGNFFAAATMVLCLSLASFPAHAAFSYTEKSPEPKTPETNLNLAENGSIILAQIGPGQAEPKQSRGDKVLLPLAIELISPDGWTPIVADGLRDKKISWQSGSDGDWVEVLEETGKRENLRFVVNWKSREIAVGEKEVEELAEKTQADSKQNPAKKKGGVTHLKAEAVEAADKDPAESAVSVSEEPWKLEPGSLKDQLTQWAERADYSFIWDSKYDYRLDAGQTFYGNFEKVVKEVITALYRNGSRVKADIYTKNQVLYISGGPER